MKWSVALNPFAERRAAKLQEIKTVDELFTDWYENDLTQRLRHLKVPLRDYHNHIVGRIRRRR